MYLINIKQGNNCINGLTRKKLGPANSRITKSTLKYLGNLIRIARKEHGVSQRELAERINVNRDKVRRIESGDPNVRIGSVFEACFVLRIPLMGCSKESINNFSQMISYINKLIPTPNIPSKDINFNDDF